jgi:hypothetical protein
MAKLKKVIMKDNKNSSKEVDKKFLRKDYNPFTPSKEAIKKLKEDRFLDEFTGRCSF